jgi:DNA-binding NarL/FixJ family response regulator
MSIIAPSPFAQPSGTVNAMSAPVTLIIADDHPLFRTALKAVVGQLLPTAKTVEAESLETLIQAVDAHADADLVLLDLRMPGAKGFSSLIQLRGLYPAIPVAIVSAEEEPATMRRALDFGATGFIPKSAALAQIGNALRTMLAGEVWLPDGIGDGPRRQPHAAAVPRADAAVRWPAQQADRRRSGCGRSHRQGSRHRDPAQAQALSPHPGGGAGAAFACG